VPTYAFRCPGCGPFDRWASMSAVPDAAPCPTCGQDAPRGVTAPALHTPGTAHRVAAAHERSAHAPDVVGAVPSGPSPGAAPRPRASPDPRHTRLPRP
jgi:putative FmdB family regulatory protein